MNEELMPKLRHYFNYNIQGVRLLKTAGRHSSDEAEEPKIQDGKEIAKIYYSFTIAQ